MNGIISKIIKIEAQKLPPSVEFIEKQILSQGLEPLRWAIVEINGNELLISASGRTINNVN